MTAHLPLTGLVAPGPGDPHRLEDLWLPIGPTSVHGGQNAENADITGRVRQVAVSPSGRRVYAATAGGGVWYSGDEGSTWTSLGGWVTAADEAHYDFSGNSLTCGSLVVDWDPLDPAENDTVYVGTGEISPGRSGIPGGKLGGVGVLRAQSPAVTARADPFAPVWTAEAPDLAGAGVYRLAMDPGDATRVAAASSVGLYLRTAPGGIATWNRVTTGPFSERLVVTDAWWAPGAPPRLWVAVPGRGLYVTDDAASTFHQVALPDMGSIRLALGVSADGAVGYVLGDGPRLWRVAGGSAKRVSRVPAALFGQGSGEVDPDAAVGGAPSDLPAAANAAAADQAFYDMAVAVDPGDPNRIVLGGSAIEVSNGAVFVCRVDDPGGSPALSYDPASDVAPRSPSADPTFVGFGLHPDVHGALFARRAGGLDLWVTCDGGIFRSRQADRYTWQPRNNGLAVTEPGYIACHPTVEGLVVVGTQDNGVLVREGDTRWRWAGPVLGGDGGGVAFDPTAPHRVLAQATGSWWRSSDGTVTQPVLRTSPLSTEQAREDAQAMFYSTPAAVATTNPAGTRIAVGTNRVWVSDDFGTSWYTVPTGIDPIKERLSEAFDVTYGDIHTEGSSRDTVVVCRWQDENVLVVLCERSLRRITRDVSGRWSEWVVLTDKKFKCSTYTASDIAGPVLDHLPPVGDWSDLALQPKDPGSGHTPLYVACAGLTATPAMDTLWWYDGAGPKVGKWYATGLRAAVRAPALSVVLHPTDPNTVYAGTTLGVWAGTFTPPDGVKPPKWDWSQYSKGLPEGAVQDLAIFRAQATDTTPALVLLRAAVAARGVWEVDLLGACDELTYLRVHPLDVRWRFPTDVAPATTDALRTGQIESGGLSSPDIVVHPAPPVDDATMPSPPAFPMSQATFYSPSDLWTFQTAFRLLDPVCRPTGAWSETFDRALRRFRVAHGFTDVGEIDADTWTLVVTRGRVWQDPWDGFVPTEVDLADLFLDARNNRPPREFDRRLLRADVLVHHRGAQPLQPADAAVLLLRRPVGTAQDPETLAIGDAWKAATVTALTASPPATGWPDGWTAADPAVVQHPVAALDAAHPQIARFGLAFQPAAPLGRYLLLAVCSSTTARVTPARLAGATVLDLVRTSPHVAARLVTLGHP